MTRGVDFVTDPFIWKYWCTCPKWHVSYKSLTVCFPIQAWIIIHYIPLSL